MNAVFIILGSLLGVALLAVAALLLFAPEVIEVEQRIVIDAPRANVFDEVRLMSRYPEWSPFREQDPEQRFRIEGNDGEVGVKFHWVGVKEVSEGHQTLTRLVENESLTLDCSITKPFESSPQFKYDFADENGKTRVAQRFTAELPIPANAFGALLNLKEKIEATNARGLERLKTSVEKRFAVKAAMQEAN